MAPVTAACATEHKTNCCWGGADNASPHHLLQQQELGTSRAAGCKPHRGVLVCAHPWGAARASMGPWASQGPHEVLCSAWVKDSHHLRPKPPRFVPCTKALLEGAFPRASPQFPAADPAWTFLKARAGSWGARGAFQGRVCCSTGLLGC